MTSDQDMSLQVKSTSTSFLPSSSFIEGVARGHLFNSQSSSSNDSDLVVVDMAHYQQQHTSGEEQIEKGETQNFRSIVSSERPGQNSVPWNSVLERTPNNFAEHRETDTISPLFPSLLRHEWVMGVSRSQPSTDALQHYFLQQDQQQQHDDNNDLGIITSHQPTSSPSSFLATEAGEGGNTNNSLSWGTGGLFTTPSTSSLFQGNHPKPAEPALGLMTGRAPSHETKFFQQQQYQPQHSSFTLLSQQQQRQQHNRPPIQQHTATAAEIALGLPSSSFNQNQKMGDGTSYLVSRNSSDHIVESKQDSKSTDGSNSSLRGKDGEEETSRTEDTFAVNSSGRLTPLQDSSDHGTDLHRLSMVVGTPSTVSTAPSSDDASLGTDYKLDESMLTNLLHPLGQHRRADSWGEEGLLPSSAGFITPPRQFNSNAHINPWQTASPAQPQRPENSQQRPWGEGHPQTVLFHQTPHPPQQQRVATFRNEGPWGKHGTTTPLLLPPQQHTGLNCTQYPHQHVVAYPRQQPSQTAPQQQLPQSTPQIPQGARKQSYAHQAAHLPLPQHSLPHGITPPTSTPPKNPRQQRPGARQTPSGSPATGQHQTSANARSASEILKTLLRKKACLYESDTSRSVALITWLVGRELALEYGFFSRQQLQSGVHACVSSKIESGTITRTKVNRCMQIILNSCFHYIIPRSDGTEENGDHFRAVFAETVQDDSAMLQYLPEPWNDLQVDRETVLEAALHESDEKPTSSNGKSPSATPKSSPKIVSVNAEKSPDRDSHDGDKDDSKRAVLLCFNENVRCAEDVFRCHNEFIRDTGNAAHLQLTAQEWRQFFGREASRAPYLWGSVGIPTLTGESAAGPPRRPDLLGQMSKEEVAQFRSSWCTKRYEHDHDLCGFAHVEVNGGWLRRNPLIYAYKDEMCNFISTAGDKLIGPSQFFLNECPKGVHCDHAHSMEEIVYHPNRYKTKVCTSLYSQSRGCRSGDVCPNLHPPDVTKPMRKAEMMRSQGGRRSKHEQSNAGVKPSLTPPTGSPVVYASPAPFSSFDQLLGMPGLQSIYRRQSAVIRAFVRSGGKAKCLYSPFGDDWGLSTPVATPKSEVERVHQTSKSS
jgi:hypothetical protein